MSFTKGPWTVGVYETTPTMLERMKLKQVAVCTNTNPDDTKELVVALCGDIDPDEKENTEQSFADARLIAAAPEMFALLDNILVHIDGRLIDLQSSGYLKDDIEKILKGIIS